MRPRRSEPAPAPRRRALAISVVAGLLTLGWVAAAFLMAGRGLAVSDESFYLLSYRWWNVDLRNYTGAQYLYGPVFEMLDFSVRGLRLFRLATVLVSHGFFAWSFMSWLRLHRAEASRSRSWELAGALVIVASGGIVYSWLPQSPGYNDVAMLGSLLAAAAVLRSLRGAQLARVLPLLPGVALGPIVVGMLLAKWSSAVFTFALLAVVLLIGGRVLRTRGWIRYLGAVFASTVGSAVFVDVAIVPFQKSLPPMIEVNRLVASGSNSPVSLLHLYLVEGLRMVGEAGALASIAAAIGALALVAAKLDRRFLSGALAVTGPPTALLVRWPHTFGLPGGGSERLTQYPVALVALALAVAASSLAYSGMRRAGRLAHVGRRGATEVDTAGARAARPPSVRLVVAAMLLLLPPAQAMGSGNPLQYLATNQYACWTALLVMAVTALPTGGVLVRFAGAATACAVLVCASTGANGVLVHPYRSSNYETSTTPIGGHGGVASLLVTPEEAEFYGRLREVLGDELRAGRPMMSFNGGSGLILVLGGRSVGEGWYPSRNWDRSAAGIRAACAHGNPWPADLQPVIFYARPDDRRDRGALRSCGLNFRTDYRLAGSLQSPHGPLDVYLPDLHHRLPRR